MEFTNLSTKPPTNVEKDSMNGMWDFDLLGKSDADVFDVNFLQSQANDQINRERTKEKAKIKSDDLMNQEKQKEQASKIQGSDVVDINDQRLKDEKLAKLVSAGFDAQKAHQALKRCQWDIEMAVDILFNEGGSQTRENQSRSPTRQSEVFQALGMSMIKGAQKVFDYSKKKITQVVESSKSSGWMNELNKSNEKSDYPLERPSLSDDMPATSKLVYSEKTLVSERLEGSRLKESADSRPNKPVRSFNKNQNNLSNFSPSSIQKKEVTVKPTQGGHDLQKKQESLFISGLHESTETTTISDAKVGSKQEQKENVPTFAGNQSLGLLDSSIDFNLSGSDNILNPTISSQPLKSDISKHNENIPNFSANFHSNASMGQTTKNIPLIPNHSLGVNKPRSVPALKQAAQPSSNISLNQSPATSNSSKPTNQIKKPTNQVNLDPLDLLLGTLTLGESSLNSKAEVPINSKKQSNDFNILTPDLTQAKSAASYQSQGGSISKMDNIHPKKGLLYDPFDFSGPGKSMITPSTTNTTAFSSNQTKVADVGKTSLNNSFMMFDSIHDKSNIASTNFDQAKTSPKSEANILKDKGNEFFKAGQYSHADSQYTLAIDSLPEKHPLLPVLYNNRAGARLKTGSYHDAIQDCNKVQQLEPNEVKSLLRRAQAFEALEKWEDAQSDYRAILVIDPTVKSLSQSLLRCSKAQQSSNIYSTSAPRPKKIPEKQDFLLPSHTSFNPKTIEVTAAVQLVREKNKLAESEDALKLALKDQIDDKIHSWRRGKEDNLRALLSSLDTVLWKELEWKTINLSEILTQSQVKVKYLRAIAKVHPDKLGSNLSIENQLIANSVFSSLNKAWDAFKTQNGM